MKPTDILKEEHKVIRRMLEILSKLTDGLEKGSEFNTEHGEKIVDFIRTFADKCHHKKEEDLLFVAMENSGIPREGGPIGVMLMEHDRGRSYVKGMDEAIKSYKNNDKDAIKKFIENANGYVSLLDEHIYKEDNILYMMADMHLGTEEQEELLKEFERVEKEIIGEGVHEKYLKLVEQLEDIYMN